MSKFDEKLWIKFCIFLLVIFVAQEFQASEMKSDIWLLPVLFNIKTAIVAVMGGFGIYLSRKGIQK